MINHVNRLSIGVNRKFSDEDFKAMKEFVEETCGIEFSESNRFILEKRVFKRIDALKLKSPREYLFFLKYSSRRTEEIEKLINILTTNETYFFREKHQLRAFSEEILPEIFQKESDKKVLRIWSAGCSTGEEPYTIAILVKETGLFDSWKVEIYATDINTQVLEVAREGVYSTRSFRDTEQKYILKYFEKMDGGKFRVKKEIKEMVAFGKLNLLDTQRIKILPSFHVIFCRNVLIYFTLTAKKKVAGAFYHVIKDGGYLLLGHAESLISVSSDFEIVHLKNDIVYRKPFKGEVKG